MPQRLFHIWILVISFFAEVVQSQGAQVLSIAHRGGALYAPENTVAAFTNSRAITDLMETDAQITSDGKFVIMHDLTVDRTTDGTGTIVSQTLAQLKLLDAGSWFSTNYIGERIPTMEEMITNTLPFSIPFIESKAGAASAYVAEFQRLNVVTNIIFQSFDWNFLAQTHALEPNLRLCALGSGTMTASSLISITNAGVRIVSWAGANVTSNEVNLAHGMGLTLYVWTINSGAEITNFINMGVDGIVSDDPWTVRGVPPPIIGTTNPPPSPTYLGDRLVAYWKMDDGLAYGFTNVVADSKGTNHATLVRNDGISHWISGGTAKLGGSLQLAGLNAYVNMPTNDNLNINTNELSISTWVRLEILPAQLATSFGPIYDSTSDCYVLYLDKANNELRFKITDSTGAPARPGIAAPFLQTNQWLHIAAVYNGNAGSAGRATIYLNGALMDTHIGSDNSPGTGLTGNVKIGQVASMGREGPAGANYFSGMVDDFALWKRALTQTEIQNIFNGGQLGQSLGDLMIQPTNLLVITSIIQTPPDAHLEINFQNLGPWSSFQLRRSTNVAGPFFPVSGLVPAALGGGNYRYDYSPTNNTGEFFRIEGL
ncbi:MAG: glycerophosphodiester phosphodiesterase family protein [Verrucomicrobiales bacterium]|nr:glycerophosphodiester phosphodiesterase family protein [Verrucomicrobiales bacterium]